MTNIMDSENKNRLSPREIRQERARDVFRLASSFLGVNARYQSPEIVSNEDPEMSNSYNVFIEREGDVLGITSEFSMPARPTSGGDWGDDVEHGTSKYHIELTDSGSAVYFERVDGDEEVVFDSEDEVIRAHEDSDHPVTTHLNALISNLIEIGKKDEKILGATREILGQIAKREEERVGMESNTGAVYFGSEESPTTLN